MKVMHYDAICNTPGLRLAVRGWSELLEAGLISEGGLAISWDHKSIVASTDDGKPIGVLTWVSQDWSNELCACLAYVLPEWRRQGVQAAMWRLLVDKAVELKRPIISASAAIDNAVSRKIMAAQGLVETGVSTRYVVGAA
jgi:RimJ/RimL family protein N-acetyltransferase